MESLLLPQHSIKILSMKVQLIQGEFSKRDALDLITQMIQVKIRYHEGKIQKQSTEEDIKWRETKIKKLQKELYELKIALDVAGQTVRIEAVADVD